MNPNPGGSKYTSAKKAREYIRRGRAEMVNGMLRFIDRGERIRHELINATYWNGSPKPHLLRHVSGSRGGSSMRLPGEVRS